MTVTGWRAFYADARQFDSAAHSWSDLPDTGVLGIVVYHEPPYRTIVDGGDWYYLDDGMPTSTPTSETWGDWLPEPDAPDCKRGAATDDETWAQVQRDMMTATEWP